MLKIRPKNKRVTICDITMQASSDSGEPKFLKPRLPGEYGG